MKKHQVDTKTPKELEQMRAELLAEISRELRTPLTSIKGLASSLLQPDVQWTEDEKIDFLQAIGLEVDRIDRLITHLSDMSYLENRSIPLNKTVCQFSDILDSVRTKMAILVRHQLQIDVPIDLPPIVVDQMRITQVLNILIENAVRLSRESLPISVEVRLTGSYITVSIIDKGIGIPAQLRDTLFDSFYQTGPTSWPVRASSEFPICRTIIGAHGGQIWVDSKLGEGCKFCFTLPVAPAGGWYSSSEKQSKHRETH